MRTCVKGIKSRHTGTKDVERAVSVTAWNKKSRRVVKHDGSLVRLVAALLIIQNRLRCALDQF
jgi:hypothetical protein